MIKEISNCHFFLCKFWVSLPWSHFCLVTQSSSPINCCSHLNHVPFLIWVNHSYGSSFWNCFVANNPFTCCPIIACFLLYHIIMVSSCLLESHLIVFSSSCTLVFVVNKTDLELLQFDFLSRVRIESDVHLKYLWFLRFQFCFTWPYLVCIYMWQDWTMLIIC